MPEAVPMRYSAVGWAKAHSSRRAHAVGNLNLHCYRVGTLRFAHPTRDPIDRGKPPMSHLPPNAKPQGLIAGAVLAALLTCPAAAAESAVAASRDLK